MKSKVIQWSILFGVLIILSRIAYVNIYYPQTQLENVDKSFVYRGVNVEIDNVRVELVEKEILAVIECIFSNDSSDSISISKNNIGLIKGGHYKYCDLSEPVKFEIEPQNRITAQISFKLEQEEWDIYQNADMIFMDFEKCCVKKYIFKE